MNSDFPSSLKLLMAIRRLIRTLAFRPRCALNSGCTSDNSFSALQTAGSVFYHFADPQAAAESEFGVRAVPERSGSVQGALTGKGRAALAFQPRCAMQF